MSAKREVGLSTRWSVIPKKGRTNGSGYIIRGFFREINELREFLVVRVYFDSPYDGDVGRRNLTLGTVEIELSHFDTRSNVEHFRELVPAGRARTVAEALRVGRAAYRGSELEQKFNEIYRK